MNRVLAENATPLQRRLALSCLVGMLLVCAASAWLRLALPKPACLEWPACRAAPAAGVVPEVAVGAPGVAAARLMHRVAATAVLVMAVVLVVSLRRGGAVMLRRPAWLLLALALVLAAIGVVTAGSRSWVVLLANPLGGLAMLALAALLLRRAVGEAPRADAPRGAPLALVLLWLLQAALGVSSGAGLAVAPPLHLLLALALVCLVLIVAGQAFRAGQRGAGAALLAVTALQLLLGIAAVAGDATALRVWLHGVCAALGLAIAATLLPPAAAPRGDRSAPAQF